MSSIKNKKVKVTSKLSSSSPAATPKLAAKKTPTTTKSVKPKQEVKEVKEDEEVKTRTSRIAVDEESIRIQALQEENNADNTTFEDLGLNPQLVEATKKMGYKKPTKIQRETIPLALAGRDIIALAQTGSGKTATFALPILNQLLDAPQPFFACVMSPTRELATQIAKHFEALGSIIGVRAAVIVGGISTMDQAMALSKRPHILVGTPGRIAWHLEHTKGFSLKNLKFLVMDEADKLLQDEYEEELNKILEIIPKERHTYLFSATMTSKVRKLERASLINPAKIQVASKYETVDRLVQNYLLIPAKYKDCYLVYILTESAGNSTMIFADTRRDVQRLSYVLKNLGFSAIPLHGQMDQTERYAALTRFTSGNVSIIIATDVASRGLDIPKVDLVINYDIPNNAKDYIHRVGRTARGDKSGRAIAMVTQYDVELYQRIESLIEKQLEAYAMEEEDALILLERVTEAQRYAAVQMREAESVKKDAEEMDDDEEDADLLEGVKKRKMKRQGGGKPHKKR
ncbi:hypothetical protein PROFUN_03918 [Planoprotostelium fungivorum]|uniref:Uncharacterized protein n=1 Tax=Planoprotostelium fungivorum TaxID=1890364 RepID=A0A2P6MTP4_9EUKA|nr:hypothetical protein PROFUN_03918 [Planoprotostelium fungivorum]